MAAAQTESSSKTKFDKIIRQVPLFNREDLVYFSINSSNSS